MKKILVPSDFSQQARDAYVLAVNWAAKINCEVVLLHSVTLPTVYDTAYAGVYFDPHYTEVIQGFVVSKFKELKAIAVDLHVPVTLEVMYGDIVHAVTEAITRYDVDLVIMGTSGSSGLSEVFIGSNTEKVVRRSSVPVLSVPRATKLDDIKDIVLATTLEQNQQEFMNRVKSLQELFGAKLHVLLVNTSANFRSRVEGEKALATYARHYQLVNYELHFESYYEEENGIMDFSRRINAGLVVMGTHARKGLSHLFMGSITEDVVNHIAVPVWSYRLDVREPSAVALDKA